MSWIRELKRRNVFRVGVAYVIIAWLVAQVAGLGLESFGAPSWVIKSVLFLLVICFPLVLVFAWAFEITPDGIKLDRKTPKNESKDNTYGRKIDLAIFGLMAVAIILLLSKDIIFETETPRSVEDVTQESGLPRAELDKSIAVLPFRNRSDRDEDAYFTEGIHDDLLTSLARIGDLKVISRTSVMRYRDTDKSIPEIARELGVATLLEGGVQRSASQVRINVQLIDAQSDEHLWAEIFDRELSAENVFAIQSEISNEIATALRLVLTSEEDERLQLVPTVNLQAYEAYLLGRQEAARRTAESLIKSQSHFENAIDLDSDYALAYVGLAETLALRSAYGGLGVQVSYAPRQAAIDKALGLDPLSGEAYTSLAVMRTQQLMYDEAEEYFLRAIELSPNYATAYHWYSSMHLAETDRVEEALPFLRKAIELDPLAPVLAASLSRMLWSLGRAEEARTTILSGIERNPEFPFHYGNMAEHLLALGRVDDALRWSHEATRLAPAFVDYAVFECGLHLQIGDDVSAERCLNRIDEDLRESSVGGLLDLQVFRAQYDEATNLAGELAQLNMNYTTAHSVALTYLNAGEPEAALSFLGSSDPDLISNETTVVTPGNLWRVAPVACALYLTGDLDRANILIGQVFETIQAMHRVRGAGYGAWDVYIHAARGNRHEAIVALRDAIDTGWRDQWWRLRTLYFDEMKNEPEWIRLIDELEADISRQRRSYENNKDDPL